MSRERKVILAARVVSFIFTPFYLPLSGLIAMFVFSYFNMLLWSYKIMVVGMAWFFTILLPTFLIHLYRRYQGWTLIELSQKERRMVPYVISILCYYACVNLMDSLHIPHFMGGIVIATLLVQIVCAFINVWWKISTHMAGIGGVAGALFVFGEYFNFNPVWWLCGILLLAGVLGTSRMILRQHTLPQVVVGFFVGFVCAVVGLLI